MFVDGVVLTYENTNVFHKQILTSERGIGENKLKKIGLKQNF